MRAGQTERQTNTILLNFSIKKEAPFSEPLFRWISWL